MNLFTMRENLVKNLVNKRCLNTLNSNKNIVLLNKQMQNKIKSLFKSGKNMLTISRIKLFDFNI